MWGNWGWGMMGYFGWWGMVLGFFLFVAVIAAAIFGVRAFVRSERSGRQETSVEVLKKRYARGEIDKEEYRRILEDLKE